MQQYNNRKSSVGRAAQLAAAALMIVLSSFFSAAALAEQTVGTKVPAIVGLWKVTVTDSLGVVQLNVYDLYNFDRTEVLTHYQDPRTGNICLGAWSSAGGRTFDVVHPAFWWNHMIDESLLIPPFTQSLIGYRIARQHVTVDPGGNTLSGTFTIIRYDLSGVLVSESDWLMSAVRITPATADSDLMFF